MHAFELVLARELNSRILWVVQGWFQTISIIINRPIISIPIVFITI